jgi:hypothetical protein
MRWATTWSDTLANNTIIDKNHRYEGRQVDSDRRRIFDGQNSDAVIGYSDYQKACILMGVKDDLAITYDEFMKYRPLVITRYPRSFEGLPSFEEKPQGKQLVREFRFSGNNTSANTQLNMLAVSQAYLLIDYHRNKITQKNGRT